MKSLIVYYSYSGITRRLAEDIALITDGELLELKPQEPYSFSYNTAVKEVRVQIEKGVCPALMQYDIDVAGFDTVFIGSPNWLKTFAPPVLSFLRATDLSGKAIISMEKGINDESTLDKLYDAYMDNDTVNLLHDEFDNMIEDLREQRQIKDLHYVQEEKVNLINIVGNIVGNVDVVERENKDGEAFKVVNFSVVSKDDEGNKVYHNCSAYGDKEDIPKDFKQGDFVKLFGHIRDFIDDNGKEHSNVRILFSNS